MSLNRRAFLRTLFHGAVVLSAGSTLAACGPFKNSTHSQQAPLASAGTPSRPLPIPPLADSVMDGDTRVFTLVAQDGHAEIIAGHPGTRTWGFNGPFLGPTLRARRGERVRAEITNDLIEMTTVHWHGMKLPALHDGGPHSPINPGETWRPQWDISQPAATTWYHPHPHLATALHAYRGLAGMFIIDDDVSSSLDIPRDYGVDDIPVVIMDAKFTQDFQLDHEVDRTLGLLGTTPVVNGIANAHFAATTRRVRLRLLNGASMRFYHLTFSSAESTTVPCTLIATDSGLLDQPREVDTLILGPGERAEVIVDLTSDLTLRSVPLPGNFGIPMGENFSDFGFQDSFDILHLSAPATTSDASLSEQGSPRPLPAVLDPAAAQPVIPSGPGVRQRSFVLNTFTINGQTMDLARVDTLVDHDGPELWTVSNENADWPHNFHIHNARFWVVDLTTISSGQDFDLSRITTYGWKDTVDLPPKSTATLLVDFGYYPDPTIAYMYHCHMLLHEDSGMMGQFVITAPGQVPDVRVDDSALFFARQAGNAHSGHAGTTGVVDTSRSPYASPAPAASSATASSTAASSAAASSTATP